MSIRNRVFVFIGISLAVAGWFYFNGRYEVAVATVRKDVALDAVPAVVKVSPEFQVTITSDVDGLVKKSNLKLGQLVAEDDLLFEIDDSKYEFELAQMESQLTNTRDQFALNLDQRTALERRKDELEEFKKRTATGEYAELQLKHREEEFSMFLESQARERLARQQQLADLEYKIKLQKKIISDCKVKSPASGTVTELFVQPGEVVAMRAPLVRLFSKALLVEARINEEDFSGIHTGLKASVRFLAYGPELYSAKIIKVLPNADPGNQQYRSYLEVEIPEARLLPGLSGEASIVRNRRENTLVIPRSALFNGAVFVVEKGIVHRRAVDVGFKSLSAVEILGGLKEGEQVATSALELLSDGSRVHVVN